MIGRPLTRREDERMLRGQAWYVDDVQLPGALHVAFVRSTHAEAAIRSITCPTAGRGLLAVVTAEDLGDSIRPFPLGPVDEVELTGDPHPVLARDEVRYVGQPIAAVVADSRALAEDAAELVEVEYEPRRPVVDPRSSERALARWSRRNGDVDGAFDDARHVVRGRYALPRVVAAPIEARGCLIEHDPQRDTLTVWCSTQDSHRPLAQLAHVLGRPRETIRVIVPDVGGAFGSKGGISPEVAAVAATALLLGRPLRWSEDRFENFLSAYQGRGIEGELELALDGDGRMLALRARLLADLGAFLLPNTAVPLRTAGMLITGCYDIPVAEVTAIGARTSKVPTGPYRGAGRPDAAYMLERLVDEAAAALKIDRIDLRRRNLVRRFPYRSALGSVYDSGDFEGCLDLALRLSESSGVGRPRSDRVSGTGIALFVERAGGAWESAEVELNASGQLTVRSSSSPHGQGHDTAFAQIAAERLGINVDQITIRFGDSAEVPGGVGTFGSRSLTMAGSALAVAVDGLIERGRELLAALLAVPVATVSWEAEERRFAANGQTLPFAELVEAAVSRADPSRPGPVWPLRAAARFESEPVFASGAYVASVEIDVATGHLDVLRVTAVDDAGNVINPLLVHGQVLGGAVQALGECLVEEAIHDELGQPRTLSLMDYALLTAADTPSIVSGAVTSPSPLNPLGAKGAGEAGTIGTLAAVANAVADAVGRHVDPPFTDEKLWWALR